MTAFRPRDRVVTDTGREGIVETVDFPGSSDPRVLLSVDIDDARAETFWIPASLLRHAKPFTSGDEIVYTGRVPHTTYRYDNAPGTLVSDVYTTGSGEMVANVEFEDPPSGYTGTGGQKTWYVPVAGVSHRTTAVGDTGPELSTTDNVEHIDVIAELELACNDRHGFALEVTEPAPESGMFPGWSVYRDQYTGHVNYHCGYRGNRGEEMPMWMYSGTADSLAEALQALLALPACADPDGTT